jgi:hypothetical protein
MSMMDVDKEGFRLWNDSVDVMILIYIASSDESNQSGQCDFDMLVP